MPNYIDVSEHADHIIAMQLDMLRPSDKPNGFLLLVVGRGGENTQRNLMRMQAYMNTKPAVAVARDLAELARTAGGPQPERPDSVIRLLQMVARQGPNPKNQYT